MNRWLCFYNKKKYFKLTHNKLVMISFTFLKKYNIGKIV